MPLRRTPRISVAASVFALSVLIASCAEESVVGSQSSTASSSSLGGAPGDESLGAMPIGEPTDVVTGLDAPWSVVFVGNTALVSERDTGRVVELLPGGGTREVGTIESSVARGEGGLLGLAVRNADLFVFSTNSEQGRIERYPLTGNEGSYGLGQAETILDGLPSASYHNGGRLAFGPDGMLYASVGDAGDRDSAQDLDMLSGKVLRMTPDGGAPDDNPFAGSLVYSYGHRNVQGIAWAEDGTMFVSEFGQDTWDELNIIEAGGNYGWPEVEGIGGREGFIDPVQQWDPDASSPSGIAVVGGTVFIAGLRGEVLTAVPVADPTSSVDLYAREYGRLRDVTLSPDGTLWFMTNNTDGRGTPEPDDDRILGVALMRSE